MADIYLQVEGVKELRQALGQFASKLPNEIANAINKTAARTKTAVNVEVRKELNIGARDLKRLINIPSRASKARLSSSVTLDEETRPGIGGKKRRFSPKQNKKGVSYKISKSKGKKFAAGAFMGPRPGAVALKLHGGVFKRKGKGRTPIEKLHGASPWAVYLKHDMDAFIKKKTEAELAKQIDSRIRTNLKQRGLT